MAYQRRMAPELVTKLVPDDVSLAEAREACKKISNPEHGRYFEQLFIQIMETFQPENQELSLAVKTGHDGAVDFHISNVTKQPAGSLPALAYQQPVGIKLIGQPVEVTDDQHLKLKLKYECRVPRPRDRSPVRHRSRHRHRSPSPRSSSHSGSESVSSPSPPRRQQRRSPSPPPRPSRSRTREPATKKKSTWSLFS